MIEMGPVSEDYIERKGMEAFRTDIYIEQWKRGKEMRMLMN